MKEQLYTCLCPVHKHSLTSSHIRQLRIGENGAEYSAPLFYCYKCNEYYIFVKELSKNYKVNILGTNGRLIHIIGTNAGQDDEKIRGSYSRKKEKKSIESVVGVENEEHNSNAEKKLKVNVIPPGGRLPKKCLKCGNSTYEDNYEISEDNGIKFLRGKKCKKCGAYYYHEHIVKQHPRFFSIDAISFDSEAISKNLIESNINIEKERDRKNRNSPETCPVNSVRVEKKTISPKKQDSNTTNSSSSTLCSAYCPKHKIKMHSSEYWKPGIPLFYCKECQLYYIQSKAYSYGKMVGSNKGRVVINSKLYSAYDNYEHLVESTSTISHNNKLYEDEIKESEKHTEEYKAYCPEHNVLIRFSDNWKTTDPLFYCSRCQKYYMQSDKIAFGSIVGVYLNKKIINADLKIETVNSNKDKETTFVKNTTVLMYTDDYGVEFDFSGLEHILML